MKIYKNELVRIPGGRKQGKKKTRRLCYPRSGPLEMSSGLEIQEFSGTTSLGKWGKQDWAEGEIQMWCHGFFSQSSPALELDGLLELFQVEARELDFAPSHQLTSTSPWVWTTPEKGLRFGQGSLFIWEQFPEMEWAPRWLTTNMPDNWRKSSLALLGESDWHSKASIIYGILIQEKRIFQERSGWLYGIFLKAWLRGG